MAEGFKLLDAYVEVKANATGIGEKVVSQFTGEIAPAAKKMADAVDTASQRVIAAAKRQADAAGALRLAQARLADVEKTSTEGSTALAAAQESVAKAQRNVASATDSADRAQRSLGTAQTRLKESGTSAGSSYLSGLKGSLTTGMVGGLIGGVTSSVTSGVVNIVSSAVSDIGGMLTTVGGMVATTVIDFNSELQSADIGFTTMLGSGAKAKSFLDDLQNFAKVTPFDFSGLVSNAQNMMGMGIAARDVIPDLRALGDSVASIGGSASQVDQVTLAFDQMAAKGTLDMGNMNQLMQGGVPSALKIMAAGFHTTTGKMIEMISTGKVQSTVALPMLVKGIEKGTKATAALGGMMDKQSTTFTGALSNIRDGLTQTVSTAFKPFFDTASHGMQRFATALSGKPAQKFTKDVTATLKPFAKAIDSWFKGIDIGKVFSTAGKMLKDAFKGVKPKDLTDGLKDLTDALGNIVKQTPKVIKVVKEMGPAFVATLKQVGDIIGGISDFVDWLDKLEKGFTSFHDVNKSFKKDGEDIQGIIGAVGSFIGDRAKSIQSSFSQIASFFADRVKSIQLSGKQLTDFFGGIPAQLTAIGGHMVDGLVNGFTGAFQGALSNFMGLVNLIPAGIRKLLGIASPSKVFHLIGTQVGQGLHLGMTSTIPAISRSAAALTAAVMGHRKKLGKTTTSRLVAEIRRDAKDLSSLSTVFHKAAADVSSGIHRGLLGNVDQIKATSQQMVEAVQAASRMFGKTRASRMVAAIRSDAGTLERMSTSRDAADTQLADAKTRLNDVLSARASFAANVKSNVMGSADVSSIFGTSMQSQADARQAVIDANGSAASTVAGAALGKLNGQAYQPSWTATTAARLAAVPKVSAHAGLAAVKASLKDLLTDTRKFSANLARLAKMGVDPATYDELVQAGVRGGGLETSAALLADPTMARSIFSLERQIGAAGASLGGATAGREYAGQVTAARRAVATDQRNVNNITVHMVVEAKKIDEVQKLVHMVSSVKHTARKKKSRHH